MFRGEDCLIVSFLKTVSEGSEEPGTVLERERFDFPQEEREEPDWMRTETPEQLAEEILEFKRNELPDYEDNFGMHSISNLFWKSKGIETSFSMSSKAELKMEKANLLAQRMIQKEADEEERKRVKEEKEKLPSLVSDCVDWAGINGLKKLAHADVDSFVIEKDIDILNETRRAL